MTQDEIIAMAKQAGICTWLKPPVDVKERLEAFAKLVDAKASAREREACAKVCDEYDESWYAYRKGAAQCATSIRSRGEA